MIFAANFKMNHTRESTREYIKQLSARAGEKKAEDSIYIFPPATALDRYEGDFKIGAQNAYPAVNGAYTGEIGLEQLEEFDIDTILIGHSERRELLRESQEIVSNKFKFFAQRGFEIIYCIGEPLEVREQGDQAVADYLLSQFEGIDINHEKLIVAYEPIWAIGTGRSATTEEIGNTHSMLRQHISCPLLYGGSVKSTNIASIIEVDNVDGVLVGGASLEVDSFMELMLS